MNAISKKIQLTTIIAFVGFLNMLGTNAYSQCSQLAAFTDVCDNIDSVLLTGGSPIGGVYFGPGVSAAAPYYFNPTAAGGAGTYQIGYEAPLCGDTAYENITVTAVVAAEFTGLDTAYCLEEPSPITLTPINPATGGIFGPTGIMTGSDFNVPTTPGNYEVFFHYTDANGCPDTAFKDVRIRPKPTVAFVFGPNDANVCDSRAAFVIDKSFSTPNNGVFAGTGVIGGNIFDPAISGVGTFKLYYTATGPLGCENVDSSNSITVTQSPTVSFELPVDSICVNSAAIFLNVNGLVNGNPAPGSYSGPGVSGPPFIFEPFAAGTGTHTIEFTAAGPNGCTNFATRTIKVNPTPTITFNNIPTKCANDTAFLLNIALPMGGIYSGVGVAPDGVTFDPALTPGPGTYQISYIATNAFGCVDTNSTGTVELDTFPDVTFTTNPTPPKICLGDTLELTANSSFSNANFTWGPNVNGDLNPQTGDNITAQPGGDKLVILTARLPNGCENTENINIQVVQPAQAIVSGDTSICWGDSTTLTASGASTYQWETGETTASITWTPIWDTTYAVIALSETDGNGKQCSSDTTEGTIVVNPLPILSAGIDTTAFIGDELQLIGRGAVDYIWSGALDSSHFSCTACPDPIVQVFPQEDSLSIRYYVQGTDENGCINNDSILVSIDENVIVFVPTAFSPNEDGLNDSLYVRGKGIKSLTFQIFNRRGEEVFMSKDMAIGWDGTYEGEPMNKEVFVYLLKVTPYIREPFKQTGSVILVR